MQSKAIDYFISYPKSGRTLVRFMYNRYLMEVFGMKSKTIYEAEVHFPHYWKAVWTHANSAIDSDLQFYQIGNLNTKMLKDCACVWITRDIKDTLVSAYHQAVNRAKSKFVGTPAQFLRNTKLGAVKILTFYLMMENINFKRLHKISYESLSSDKKEELIKLLKFAGLEIDQRIVDVVVEESSFENMKQLSLSPEYSETDMAPAEVDNEHSYKVRKGKVGVFSDLYDEADREYLERVTEIIRR